MIAILEHLKTIEKDVIPSDLASTLSLAESRKQAPIVAHLLSKEQGGMNPATCSGVQGKGRINYMKHQACARSPEFDCHSDAYQETHF